MEKDFITTSQDSGKGDALVNINVKPNLNFKSREVNLDVNTLNGVHKSVKAIQSGIPLWACIHLFNKDNDNGTLRGITSDFSMGQYPNEHIDIESTSSSVYCSISLLADKSVLDIPEHELTIDTSNGVTTNFNHKFDYGNYNLYVYDGIDYNVYINYNDSMDITISENSNFDPILWEFTLNWY